MRALQLCEIGPVHCFWMGLIQLFEMGGVQLCEMGVEWLS